MSEDDVTPSGPEPEVTLKVDTSEDITPGSVEEALEDNTSTSAPTMKDMVMYEVKRLAMVSKHFQTNIKDAKTQPKKNYFLKKLRKNNKLLANMIIRLEQLNKMGDTSG